MAARRSMKTWPGPLPRTVLDQAVDLLGLLHPKRARTYELRVYLVLWLCTYWVTVEEVEKL